MKSAADGFLARIRELPDEDGPRLIYADWLDEQGDPRGEFIRVQIALARLSETDRRRSALVRTELDLLGKFGDAWIAPFRGLATGPVFRRGFVEEVNVTARQFLTHATALFAAAPIRHIHFLDLGSHIFQVMKVPYLARLTALTIFAQHLGEDLAHAVAETSYLAKLISLNLGRNRIGDAGAVRIAMSPFLASLEQLDLSENDLGDETALAIGESGQMIALKQLELHGNAIASRGVKALAHSARLTKMKRLGLGNNRVGAACTPQDHTTPRATPVGSWDLSSNHLTSTTLGYFLRDIPLGHASELDLGRNELGDSGAEFLAEQSMFRGLRILRLNANGITDEGLHAMAQSTCLEQIVMLDLTNNPIGDPGFRSLLQSQNFRHLKKLAFPRIGLGLQIRQELERRFNRESLVTA